MPWLQKAFSAKTALALGDLRSIHLHASEHLRLEVDYMYYLVVNVPSIRRSMNMTWSKPAYTDLRIGFEVTMYFASR